MRIKPVKSYRNPSYPTRLTAARIPALLRAVPRRWHAHSAVLALLGVGAVGYGVATEVLEDRAEEAKKVAPIFVHGDGRVSHGGIGSSGSASLMDEDDAFEIIMEEAACAGVMLEPSTAAEEIPFMRRLVRERFVVRAPWKKTRTVYTYDLMDREQQIAVEFVSGADVEALGRVNRNGTVSSYDTRDLAEEMQQMAARAAKPDGKYGVLYDPLEHVSIPFDEEAFIRGTVPFDERTMVPVEFFQCWKGVMVAVDRNSGVVSITGPATFTGIIGERAAMVNDEPVTLPVPITSAYDRTFVPLGLLAHALGGEVKPVTGRIRHNETKDTIPLVAVTYREKDHTDATYPRAFDDRNHDEHLWRVARLPLTETTSRANAVRPAYTRACRLQVPETNMTIHAAFTAIQPWERANIKSRQSLRAQVRDFIAWLKAEGAI